MLYFSFFYFFQAEDGIRDVAVTGVQTCALPISLGTPVDVTVFRKLQPLDYLTSYSHRGRYYTLREIARFDDNGLWSQAAVWFSRFGTLLATAEAFVNRSPRGYFADELTRALHVEVQDA